MKDAFKVAAVFIGTIVGAGLASGQEILQFFGLFGVKGFWGILVCCILYIAFAIIIINLCYQFKFRSYRDIVGYIFGKKFGWVVDIFLTFFIFAGNTIMISGGGAMLHEYAGIEKFWGIFIMAGLAFLVTFFSTSGIIAANSVIVPFSSSIIILVGVSVVITCLGSNNISYVSGVTPIKHNWLWSSIIYAAFNLMGATGVLCPMIAEAKAKRPFIRGAIIGSVVLTLLALSINFSILYYCPQSFHNEIPNLFIARQYGYILPLLLTIIIWLEMFSTEIGDLYSLSKAFQHTLKITYTNSLLLVLAVSIPFSFLGFSNLIKLLYPPCGVVSLVFILGCLYRYVFNRH